jgi:hypothetical protein
MNIPDDRLCPGQGHDGPGGEILHSQCWNCARRPTTEVGIARWMDAPREVPCPERQERQERQS